MSPLVADHLPQNHPVVTRDYSLELDSSAAPLLTVWGGKLTTFRKLAEEAADLLGAPLAAARGRDLATGEATPIGLGCRACTRPNCPQRSAPPAGRVLVFNERERGLTPFVWAGE